jgi:hypothetical protein
MISRELLEAIAESASAESFYKRKALRDVAKALADLGTIEAVRTRTGTTRYREYDDEVARLLTIFAQYL